MTDFETLNSGAKVLVIGASGGIGRAMALAFGNACGLMAVTTLSRSADGLDITNETSVRAAADQIEGPFDVIFCATGALEIGGAGPEKSIKAMTPDTLTAQFQINAIGPALLLKHFQKHLRTDGRSVFAILSARVGSITDNQLGGWISYRSAKAALNQIIRTTSIELARSHPKAICVALHPGTVRTELTAKYLSRHPAVPPQDAAKNLLRVIDDLEPSDTGGFFDWAGKKVEW